MKIKYETISLFVIFLLVVKAVLITSVYFPISGFLEYVIELISFAYILLINITKFGKSKKRLLVFFLLTICTFYTGLKTNQLVIFSSFLMICLAQTIEDKDKMIKVIYKTLLSTLLLHFIIFILSGNFSIVFSRTLRYSLGFKYYNVSGVYALWSFCAYAYLNKNSKFKIIIGQLLLFLLYFFTKTRTMLLCSLILTVIYLLSDKKIINKIVNFISKNIVAIIVIILCTVIYMYNNNLFPDFINKVDNLSSYRLSFSVLALKEYGLTLFGQEINIYNLPLLFVDNHNLGELTMDVTYVGFLYSFGIIYIFLVILLTRSIAKGNSIHIQTLIIVWAIFALFEESSLNFIICFPMLLNNKLLGGRKV